MGLVDYSDSESDNDSPQTSTPAKNTSAPNAKKPFQKLVDKTNPGKILVNLPSAAASDAATPADEPAAKRIKTGGSRFSGFGSFLPPPKAVAKPAAGTKVVPRVGINLKTSSEAAFSREDATTAGGYGAAGDDGPATLNGSAGLGLNLPPPKASAPPSQPSIPEEQKPAEEVKMVGKPMMFKPLSVSRKPAKKTGVKAPTAPQAATPSTASAKKLAPAPGAPSQDAVAQPPRKQVSLFSFGEEEPSVQAAPETYTEYEPEFTRYDNSAYAEVQQSYADYTQPLVSSNTDPNSLDSIADDLNLDPAARRELFGRGGGGGNSRATAKSVINFNLDKEYQHNEDLRASGALDQQKHNPLRAIKPGKHSLQQLVNQVQSQKDALEENFAKNRSAQKQAGSRYGWR
ncbi:unnamed protein product [Discula destructiva]